MLYISSNVLINGIDDSFHIFFLPDDLHVKTEMWSRERVGW